MTIHLNPGGSSYNSTFFPCRKSARLKLSTNNGPDAAAGRNQMEERECWNKGMLEYWEEVDAEVPSFHHSRIPSFRIALKSCAHVARILQTAD